MRKVSVALALQLLPLSAAAQVYADFRTSVGNFTCELNAAEAPRTAANFISLAEGSRAWLDETTGRVSQTQPPEPFYDGLAVQRVANRSGFRFFQAGSRRGNGEDSPGYNFPDEFDATVPSTYRFREPYLLAMANAGPNTNGAQFIITGSAIPSLEGSCTVFGEVIDGTTTVETILSTGTNDQGTPLHPIVIESVKIRRVGEARASANEDPALPTVSVPPFEATAATGSGTLLEFDQPPSSQSIFYLRPHANTEWQLLGTRFIANDEENASHAWLDSPEEAADYRVVTVSYPDDLLTPGDVEGCELSLENEGGNYLFRFDSEHDGSYLIVSPSGGTRAGSIRQVHYQPNGYACDVIVETDDGGMFRFLLAPDERSDADTITGRQSGYFHDILLGWLPFGRNGDFTWTGPR